MITWNVGRVVYIILPTDITLTFTVACLFNTGCYPLLDLIYLFLAISADVGTPVRPGLPASRSFTTPLQEAESAAIGAG